MLVAWKKTKVDKSELKCGVAGGVIMALIGVMLLPRGSRYYWRSAQRTQSFADAGLVEEYNLNFQSLKEGKRV
jgi:hypothetical protein